MALLVQVYSPAPGSVYHRTLYAFGCTKAGCDTFSALRVQERDESYAGSKSRPKPSSAELAAQLQPAAAAAAAATPLADNWGTGGGATDSWGVGAGAAEPSFGGSAAVSFAAAAPAPVADGWGVAGGADNWGVASPSAPASANAFGGFAGLSLHPTGAGAGAAAGAGAGAGAATESIFGNASIFGAPAGLGGAAAGGSNIGGGSIFGAHPSGAASIFGADSIFGAGGNAFGAAPTADHAPPVPAPAEVATTRAATGPAPPPELAAETARSNVLPLSKAVRPFVPYYLNVADEPTTSKEEERAQELLQAYEREHGAVPQDLPNGGGKRKGGGEVEEYEDSVARHGDRAFDKFQDRLKRCPGQCLRYSWGGDALCVSDKVDAWPKPGEVKCRSCGAGTVFEIQVLPSMLYNLEPYNDVGAGAAAEPVSFGALAIYTCEESCWVDGETSHMVEHVAWHPDPDDLALAALEITSAEAAASASIAAAKNAAAAVDGGGISHVGDGSVDT